MDEQDRKEEEREAEAFLRKADKNFIDKLEAEQEDLLKKSRKEAQVKYEKSIVKYHSLLDEAEILRKEDQMKDTLNKVNISR